VAKAWGGRFQEATDARVELFTESISFDARLADCDITGSQAHARMLAKVGLITAEERDRIVTELETIRGEISRGEMPFQTSLEDIHMHIESRLIERLGDTGRKLHTGRSRNDQVATDLRLWVREAIDRIDALLVDLQRAFVAHADRDRDIVLPGYTHLQRAMPVLASHYWLAYCEKFERDRQRLADCRRRVNVCSLGAAALAGTSLPIDRHETARLLGFDDVARNSLDVSSDRDFEVEFVFCLSLIAAHLSTLSEEWIIWFTTEFGFLKLKDSFTTGSSIMPQKRNPDVLELIRGKTARVMADVQQLLILIKGLPMAYNRDLQEDKLALFDAFDTVAACLAVVTPLVDSAELRVDRINEKLDDGFLDATALMEYLIKRGVPMRTGHETVGRLVALCDQRSCRLSDLPLNELQTLCPVIEADVASVLGTRNAVASLQSFGSGGRNPVSEQIAWWQQRLCD